MSNLLLVVVPIVLGQLQAQAPAPVVPLEGLDPVALIQGQQLDGDKKFAVVRGQFQYQFATAQNKATFEKDPTRYEIQLEGACARMGPGVTGNADLYLVKEGRIYIFGSAECQRRFNATPEKYLESKQPPILPLSTSPEAAARAKQLLDKAVQAAGGASAIDGLHSYQESRDANKEVQTVMFPDRHHTHRVFNEKFVVDEVVTSSAVFRMTPNGPREVTKTTADELRRAVRRTPLAILRARNDKDFRAAAADDHVVEVEWQGDRMTLLLDPQTAQLSAIRFRTRANGGEIGQVEFRYSDFRKTGGLTLPYAIDAAFNGEPVPALSAKVVAITLNPEVPASLFEKAK